MTIIWMRQNSRNHHKGTTMTAEDIRTVYYTKPFQPFVVRLTDGRKFRVAERHNIGISPTGESIMIATKTDEYANVKIADVAALDVKKVKGRK